MKKLIQEYIKFFRKQFPYVVRAERIVEKIFSAQGNGFFESRNKKGKLVGLALLNKSTILMLAVDKKYQGRGIGSKLLQMAEAQAEKEGWKEINVGAGEFYLTPGVPTDQKPFDEELKQANIFDGISNEGVEFFKKKGYSHSWEDANCFDMFQKLHPLKFDYKVGDTVEGITFNWAGKDDQKDVCKCVRYAYPKFGKFYKDENLYGADPKARVLVAKNGDKTVGALIVNIGRDDKKMGSIGCTVVKVSERGKHIASNMAIIATNYFRQVGLKTAHLSYTFSGLDVLYGYSGYQICSYYFMGKKKLN